MKPRYWIETALVACGVALADRVPLARAQALIAWVARRAFDREGKRARMALANLRVAFPDATPETLRAIGRESFVHTALNAFDLLRAERWGAADYLARCDVRGLEHLERALAGGRGAFLLTAHLGNFDLGGRALAVRGVPTSGIVRRLRNPRLWRRVTAARELLQIELIDHHRAVPAILRALRRGRMVGILLDQYGRRSQSVFVPLFGKRASTSSGLALLALRTRAPVVPGYVVRDGPDHHVIVLEPPLELPDSGDRDADVRELTARCNAALEAAIRKHPEQWMWAHRRFRHSPDLPAPLY